MSTPRELVSTAHSPLTDGQLHAWGWEIPVYLFLGGLTAGLLVLWGQALWRGRGARRGAASFALGSSGLPLLGLGALSAGMLALLLDLTHKPYAWRLYLTFKPLSPMSWGAWILLLVYPVLFLGVALEPPRGLAARMPRLFRRLRGFADHEVFRRRLGLAAVVGGVALGLYTGVLLSSLGARPLWSSALLGPLFLVSGLSTGAALAHALSPEAEERHQLLRLDSLLLTVELGLLALFLVGLASSSQAQAAAAQLLLGGPYTAVFWVGVVFLGLLVPLALQLLTAARRIAHTPIASLLVLGGGLTLRFLIVLAGQASHYSPS